MLVLLCVMLPWDFDNLWFISLVWLPMSPGHVTRGQYLSSVSSLLLLHMLQTSVGVVKGIHKWNSISSISSWLVKKCYNRFMHIFFSHKTYIKYVRASLSQCFPYYKQFTILMSSLFAFRAFLSFLFFPFFLMSVI